MTTRFIERPAVDPEDQFPGLAEMMEELLTPQLEVAADPLQPELGIGLFVERMAFDLPIELQTLRDPGNRLTLGISTPTQWIETSVEPVLHRLRVTWELDNSEVDDLERDEEAPS